LLQKVPVERGPAHHCVAGVLGHAHDREHVASDQIATLLPRAAGDDRIDVAGVSGHGLIRSVRGMTISASFPGLSLPTLSSRLAQRVPSMVANSSASRQVRSGGGCTLTRLRKTLHALKREDRPHDHENRCYGHAVVGTRAWAQAMVERVLDGGQSMPHRHFDLRAEQDAAARILDQPPRIIIEIRAVNVFVAGPHEPCAPGRQQALYMEHGRHPRIAGDAKGRRIECGLEHQSQQLIFELK
jgi:hypothetical protein